MTSFLDIRSVGLATAVVLVVLGLVMLQLYRRRRTYPGFREWTVAAFAGGAAMAAFASRGFTPDFVNMVLANACIGGQAVLAAAGLERFYGRRVRVWAHVVAEGVFVVVPVLFGFLWPSITVRIVLISGVVAVYAAYCAFLVEAGGRARAGGPNRFVSGAFLVQAIWQVVRVGLTLLGDDASNDFLKNPAVHAITFLVYGGVSLAALFGLTMLTLQRVEQALEASLAEVRELRGIIPICASCKKVRDDQGRWQPVELYVRERSRADFSHGVCPDCERALYPEYAEEKARRGG